MLLAARLGAAAQQQLFYPHDVQWIPEGLPGAEHLLVFNNGPRPTGLYSSVDEVVLAVGPDGRYEYTPEKAMDKADALRSSASERTDYLTRAFTLFFKEIAL